MFSDIGFPNVTFYSQRICNPAHKADLNGIVMVKQSSVREITSWTGFYKLGVMELLCAIEEF